MSPWRAEISALASPPAPLPLAMPNRQRLEGECSSNSNSLPHVWSAGTARAVGLAPCPGESLPKALSLPRPPASKDAFALQLGSETNISPGMFKPPVIRTRGESLTVLWSTSPSALEGHGLYLVYVCDFPEAPRFLTVSQSRPVPWDVSGKWPSPLLQGQGREASH